MKYVAIVRFTRDLGDDANVIDIEDPTPMQLAKQLAVELQEAYDELGMAGEFQIERIVIEGVSHNVEGIGS